MPRPWSRDMAAEFPSRLASRAARVRKLCSQPRAEPMADILVVDDDASVAGALRRFLDSEGHKSRVVNGVAEGLAAIDQLRPDLVMMDIRMPGVDGLTGLDQMRAKYPGLCVVMMTGYGTSQTSIDAMRA